MFVPCPSKHVPTFTLSFVHRLAGFYCAAIGFPTSGSPWRLPEEVLASGAQGTYALGIQGARQYFEGSIQIPCYARLCDQTSFGQIAHCRLPSPLEDKTHEAEDQTTAMALATSWQQQAPTLSITSFLFLVTSLQGSFGF
eukprot:3603831-Amphidinium_carterae.1